VIAQLVTHLAARNPVALLYLRAPDEPPIDDALSRGCALTREVMRLGAPANAQERRREQLRIWLGLPRGRPTWVTRWTAPAYARELAALARAWQPEIVQIEFHVMAQYLDALHSTTAPRILNQHEPGVQAARDRRDTGRGGGRLLPRLDARAWERYERRILKQVNAVVSFTNRDTQAAQRLAPGLCTVTIPLGTDLSSAPLAPMGGSPPSILFVGSLRHAPNVDAALRLAGNIVPALGNEHPDLVLHIVGPDAPPALRQMADNRVHVTGEVPDVTPYLEAASIVVAPLRMGGGMRVKVLEALAAGKAVIASRRAVEGLSVTDGKHVILAESDEEFCRAADWLLCHPDERVGLGRRARQWAIANLGWEKSVAAYEALYAEMLARGPTGRSGAWPN
jgi:glycosyltransferase involved in cell wall biosynthesis